ncbi:MAG: hypothetical protein KAS67_06495, partial [Thermoplasmata archaeon]|nr:hypothetical protein [Thermoplasmata archaeon]
ISGTLDSVDFDYVSADFDTSFGLTLRCSVLVGVNFGIAGGGIEGWIEGRPELTLATGFDYSTPDANGNGGFEPECSGALDITLSAGLGAYAKFLWWTKSWSFWDGSYTLGHWDFDAFGGTSNGPDTPFSHEPDPSSLVNQSGDVQFPTGPSISQLGDQTVIVNSIDKNNNPANPDFQIIVDVNGASVQLTTNNKLKTDPHVLHDGTGKALVVWTESVDNQDLTGTSLNLTNFMEDSRVVYAILDGTTIEAGLAYIYTPSPPVADIQPSLVLMGNGDIMATWIHDEGGDVMTSDDQATWFSVWNGFVWSVPALKNDHASFHYDNQMAALPDDEILSVWIRDGDENLYTTDDQQLVYSVYNGTNWTLMEYLTTGNMSVESLSLSSNENYAVLAWLARDWQGAFNIKFASWDTSSETWSSIRVVNSTFYPVQLPQVAINSQGLAAVVWKSGQVMNWTNANESGIYYCTLDMTSGGGQTKPWLAAITNSPLLDFWCDMVLYDDRTLLYTFNNLTDPTDRSSKYQELAYIGLKPDFSIMNMTANGEASIIAREGDVVWINATVRNAGDVPAEDFDVRFYDGNPLLGGAFIGKVEVPSLDRMETVGISIHWAAESGCREIYGVVDAVGGIGECSENNNMASCMIDAPVDVYITYRNITLTPEEPDEWETVEIKALVKNIGFGSASDVEIEFYDGDPICGGRLLDTKTIAHIPLEGEAEVMAYWSARSGYHELFVLANISDANGENNKAFRKVWLTPDIEVSAMSVSNPMIREGEKAIISATIKNTGSGDSDNIFVKFFTHDMFIGHHFISLDQGDESTVSVDWTPPSGNYMIYASAFPTSNINELSEAENKRSASLAVISSRDVMVELALAESDEGILNITANVTNGGFGSLSGVVLRLYGGEPGTGSMKLLDTTIPELAQGETRSIMLDWIPDIDARTIYAVVDPDDVISETNENNNVAKENLDFGSWTPDGQDDDRDSGMVEAVYTGSMFGILVAVVAIIITFIIRRRKRRE